MLRKVKAILRKRIGSGKAAKEKFMMGVFVDRHMH